MNLFLIIQNIFSLTNELFNNSFKKKHEGIKLEHWFVIEILYNTPKLTQHELAFQIQRDKTFITRLIDYLEKENIVKRLSCKTDRRNKFVKLTKSGKTFYETHSNFVINSIQSKINMILGLENIEDITNQLNKLSLGLIEIKNKNSIN